MAEYGLISDVDTIKQELRNYNRDYNNRRTWGGMETDLALSAQAANTQLKYDYSTAMSQAYNAAKANQRSIAQSGVLGTQRQLAQQQNQAALEEAYNTYMSNLASGQQTIVQSYQQGMQDIDTALTEEAQNIVDYKKTHEDYLEYLWYEYQMGNNTLFDNKNWQKFLTDEIDSETGEILLDEEDNPIKRLLTFEELYKPTFNEYTDEEGNVQKEWTGMYDDQGNLTVKGVDFFDQLSNIASGDMTALGDTATFGQFIANTDTDFLMNQYGYTRSEAEKVAEHNAELYNWSKSYNPYNYTLEGTNKGTFRTMVGMASTDDAYSFAERWGGMSREQIDGLFKEYNDASVALADKMSKAKDKGKDITGEVKDLVDSAHNLAKDLGIDAQLQEYGLNWDQLAADALQYYSGTMSSSEMAGMWFAQYATAMGTGAEFGAMAGGLLGGPTNPAGLTAMGVGAAIGGAVGQITGAIIGSIEVDKQRTKNKQMAQSSKQLFDNMLKAMTSFAAYNQRQRDIEFAMKNA